MARNHDEVGSSLKGALGKTDAAGTGGELARRIRRLPALRSEVAARLDQRMPNTAGGFAAQLVAAIRRSRLAWKEVDRDWELPNGLTFRIPSGFSVTEVRNKRVALRWNTSWLRIHDDSRVGHFGHFELADGTLVIPSWLGARRIRLSAIRVHQHETDFWSAFWRDEPPGSKFMKLLGTNTAGVERTLFEVPSHQDAEFICAVICHFTSARLDPIHRE